MYFFILLCLTFAGAVPFNEALTRRGRPRASYQAFHHRTGVSALRPSAAVVHAMTHGPLGDDLKVLPVPLILSAREYTLIQRGVAQRARVLEHLFHDVLVGDQSAIRLGLIPADLVDQLFEVEGFNVPHLRHAFKGLARAQIRFIYSPDLVRGADGRWVVLEDHVGGYVGGLSDVVSIRRALLGAMKVNDPAPPVEFARQIVDHYRRERAAPNSIDYIHPQIAPDEHFAGDREYERLAAAIPDVIEATRGLNLNDHVERADRRGEPPSFINLGDLDVQDQDSLGTFIKLFVNGEIDMMFTPAVECLSHKCLLPYLDVLIDFYLGEDPLLPAPPTREVWSREVTASRGISGYVKLGAGSGGHDVVNTARLDEPGWASLRDQMMVNEAAMLTKTRIDRPVYVVQNAVEPSVLPLDARAAYHATIDLRPFAYVGPRSIWVSETALGRAAPPFGRGMMNTAQGAAEVVVLTECEALLAARP